MLEFLDPHSRATDHMTPVIDQFLSYELCITGQNVQTADGTCRTNRPTAHYVQGLRRLASICSLPTPLPRRSNVDRLEISSWETFWRSFGAGTQRLSAKWQQLFSILWVIWGHRNEVIFRGRIPSVDVIQHDARGLEQSWYQSGSGQPTYVPL